MAILTVHTAGPGLTVQDLGRPGWKAQGLSTGGAADPVALLEGAALLGVAPTDAVIEMMGYGGTFSVDEGMRFALTGAMMQADIDGDPVLHNTTHFLPAGAKLTIRSAQKGVYGYLRLAGGVATDPIMDSRATHLTAGIGARLQTGDALPVGPDPDRVRAPQKLTAADRFSGGTIRIMPGPQTDFFNAETIDRFCATPFKRSQSGNRQGIRLEHDGAQFGISGSLTHVSDLIVPGDIQIAGEGVPYILLAECQTIGGYPRIGSVIPADLPKIVQAAPGTPLRFQFITVAQADTTATSQYAQLRALTKMCQPVVRDPHDIADLLGYQLISGATPGDDLERP
ncbi:biotin-dependent carboxyltransferase family protein [Roseobacter sp. CCS2]|uniref:5-oxoprolinase subunit C family protein n=1 Tax=Roseobacter sp. CCS2 TaxID=391593 RepID=UPI0000F3E5FF|nr:biotin-dependent carboxyltransferase family protein [Roseobacter sp. CCS2]EBA12129.1 allophanate hydrolase subunit 2, putative [Roseobacter sp. CCS2]